MKKVFAVFAVFFCLAANVYGGISVIPARSEILIEKGGTAAFKYTIVNTGDLPIEVAITYKNWNNSPENKNVQVNEWLFLAKNPATLAPGESKDIEYTVKAGDLSGSVSAMISFTHKSPGHQGISLMTSVPVYMVIDGTQNVDYKIDTIVAFASGKDPKNIGFTYRIKNDGNVIVKVKGVLKVLNGKKVIVERKISEQSPTYAGSIRDFSETISSLPKGKYVLNISLSALGKTVERSIQFRVNKYGDVSY